MQQIKQLASEIIHQSPRCDYKHDKIQSSSGEESDYYYVETPGSVLIVPVTNEGKLILVRQFRYLQDKVGVEFPGGGINKDESPLEAAKRELLEETGFTGGEYTKVGTVAGAKGILKEMTHIYIASQLKQTGNPINKDGILELEAIQRRPDELEDIIKRNEVWDGQTLSAWLLARAGVLGSRKK